MNARSNRVRIAKEYYMNKTLVDILIEARNSLTDEIWKKGSYFKLVNNLMCMCSHGAVQILVNPACSQKVRLRLEARLYGINGVLKLGGARVAADCAGERLDAIQAAGDGNSTKFILDDAIDGGSIEVASVASLALGKLTSIKQDIWNNRPDWVRHNRIVDRCDYGNLDVHFLLGMVGLTVSYNDAPNTTLEMIRGKFTEAISLAQELGV
jgi:hypothetical protein